jgi:hypothetical protein
MLDVPPASRQSKEGMMIIYPKWGEKEHIVTRDNGRLAVHCWRCNSTHGDYGELKDAQEARMTFLIEDCFYHTDDEEEAKNRWPTEYELRQSRPAHRMPAGIGAFAFTDEELHRYKTTVMKPGRE